MKNMQTPTDYTGSERGLENKLPTTATPNQHYVTLDVKERERMEGWMTSNASNWSLSNSSLEADANPQNLYAISLLLSCLYTIFLFPLGLVGNVLILVVNFDPCQRMSSPDLYFTNLALADLVLVLDSLIEVFNLSARYYDDAVLCTCMALFLQVNMYSSVFSLTWMSLDRCLALTALSARSLPAQPSALSQKPRLARTACVAIWAAAVLCTLLPFASAHARHGWGRGFCFAGVAEVQWLEVTLGFAVPFCVMGACYATIARVLLLRSGAVACGRCGDDHRRRRRQRAKALRMIVAAVSVFFVCWLPENVFIGVHLLGGETEPSRRRGNSTLWQRYPLTGHVVTLAACANSCLNPLIYSLLGRTFRRKLRLFVKRHALCLARREDGEGPRPYAPTCLRGAHTHHGKASQEDSREPKEGSDAERKEACDCERDRESDSCQSV